MCVHIPAFPIYLEGQGAVKVNNMDLQSQGMICFPLAFPTSPVITPWNTRQVSVCSWEGHTKDKHQGISVWAAYFSIEPCVTPILLVHFLLTTSCYSADISLNHISEPIYILYNFKYNSTQVGYSWKFYLKMSMQWHVYFQLFGKLRHEDPLRPGSKINLGNTARPYLKRKHIF